VEIDSDLIRSCENNINGMLPRNHYLLLLLAMLKKALRKLLSKMKDLKPDHPLNRTLEYYEVIGGSAITFYRHTLDVLSDLPDFTVATVARNFITAVDNNDCPSLIEALSADFGSQSRLLDGPTGNESDTSEDPQHRVEGPSDTEQAFDFRYDRHSLEAFEEYLDIQWLEMCRLFHPIRGRQEGTELSRCSSIIQSGCTGKSRLVQE
jgi:hypothetical protein